jgi:hypothetical protein
MQKEIYDQFLAKLKTAYGSVKVGDPLEAGVLCGPLHTPQAVKDYTYVHPHQTGEGRGRGRVRRRKGECDRQSDFKFFRMVCSDGLKRAQSQGGKVCQRRHIQSNAQRSLSVGVVVGCGCRLCSVEM